MRTTVDTLHQASRDQLVTLARDALRMAGRRTPDGVPERAAPNPGRLVGLLTETIDALDTVMARTARTTEESVQAGGMTVVEGVFAGDPDAAAHATTLWLDRGRDSLDAVRPHVANAHIAAGGLASR